MSTVAERLMVARESAGESVRSITPLLVDALGAKLSHGTVHAYEQGRSSPRVDYLLAMAEITGVSPCWLLTGSDAEEATAVGVLRAIADLLESGQIGPLRLLSPDDLKKLSD